ncbi:MAG TPA: non-homologous end-joining DNA ligase [Actinomycetales bacterium]|nr:non-homologous end-joining DNA ligase [Actinomycetales bacterium]
MRPMLATPGEAGTPPPTGAEWAHEVKWDGMRLLAEVSDGRLVLTSRTEADVTVTFPELTPLATAVADAHLDGEVVALVDGRPSFGALADRMHVRDARRAASLAERLPVTFVVFDLLRLYGVPLIQRPFDERRSTLERLDLGGPQDGVPWQVPSVFDDGAALYRATLDQGLEGVVSKRRSSRYLPGRRSRDWVKRPHRLTQTYVVGGWRPQTGTTSTPGSLLVGLPDDDGGLVFLGRVGSGIGPTAAQDLSRLLSPLTRATSPFRDVVPRADALGATWVEPALLVEVAHLGLGGQGRLRQPSVKGIRTDLRPEDLRREP